MDHLLPGGRRAVVTAGVAALLLAAALVASPVAASSTTSGDGAATGEPEAGLETRAREAGLVPGAPEDGLAAETPAVVAEPATGLVDLQPVVLTGSGFPPATSVSASQCLTLDGVNYGVCYGATLRQFATDAAGTFSVSVYARRVIWQAGASADCAAPGTTCSIVVAFPPTTLIAVPLAFDPTRPPTPPSITVEPATGLRPGDRVTVTGAGFTPDEAGRIAQCTKVGFGLDRCDPATILPVAVGSSGSFTTPFTMHASVRDPMTGATTSCEGTSECALVAVNARGASEQARAPVAFAAAVAGAEERLRPRARTEVKGKTEELPRTGAALATLTAAGVFLTGGGLALRRRSRRPGQRRPGSLSRCGGGGRRRGRRRCGCRRSRF